MRNLFLIAALATAAQAIEITSPAEFQVVQRGDHNRAAIKITGKATGNVEARVVSRSGAVLPDLDWKPLGVARSGVPPTRQRASRPSRQAPAVCDDDGPTITGPMMSRSETMFSPPCACAPDRGWRGDTVPCGSPRRGKHLPASRWQSHCRRANRPPGRGR